MFKDIQNEINKLEDFIEKNTKNKKDDIFVLLTHLLAECGEAADEVKGLEGKRAESPDEYSIDDLAKEIIDVLFNALRITRYYNINLDDYFIKRLDGIRKKFEILLKTKKVYVDKDIEALKNYWEVQFHYGYDKGDINSETKKIFNKIIKKYPKKTRILIHGCGSGRLKKYFEKYGFDVYGVDWSWNALAKAKIDTPKNLSCANIDEIPYKDDFFDIVVSWEVIHGNPKHIREKSLKEIDRVLKNKGLLLCSVQSSGDKNTLTRYKEFGIELDNDKGTYAVDLLIGKQRIQRLKRFYTKNSITKEIQTNTNLKVKSVLSTKAKCGWSEYDQEYLVINAKKQ